MLPDILENEKIRLVLWLPVLFGIGIVTYFSLKSEPNLTISITIPALVLAATIILRLNHASNTTQILHKAGLAMLFATAGFCTSAIHAHLAKSPIIEADDKPIWVRATVESIDEQPYGGRIMLYDLDLWQPEAGKFSPRKTPVKARVTIRTGMDGIRPGDRVAFRAILSPPPERPVYPGGYDFARFAYFNRIGAVGYSISDVKLYRKKGAPETAPTPHITARLRHKITENILSAFPGKGEANIAAALLTGQRGGIDKTVLENMRKAGVGHLLAISGLHMALVMTTCFFAIRLLLSLSQFIALRYNIKKISAILALATGFFYLLLTGAPVSAQRAYIMVGLFFLAILLDRTGTPMRPVAWAALVVMMVNPLSVTGPSFQMSFAAVIALVAAFERYTRRNYYEEDIVRRKVPYKLAVYVGGIMLSSVVAGLATAPFAIYHFGRFASYGLLANLLSIPLTTFWIMPLGILGLLLMPLGLHGLAFVPMGWGISALTDYAGWITGLPHSSILFGQVAPWVVGVIALGGLWLCLWKTGLRFFGLLPIAVGVIMVLLPKSLPDVIIGEDGKLFAVRGQDGLLYFSSLSAARYARGQWLSANGQEKAYHIRDAYKDDIECSEKACVYYKWLDDDVNVPVVLMKEFDENYCDKGEVIVYLSEDENHCNSNSIRMITYSSLEEKGTHLIRLDNSDDITINNVADIRGKRLWINR